MGIKKPVATQVKEYLEYCEFKRRFTADTMRTKRQSIQKFRDEHPKLKDLRQLTNEQFDAWCQKMVRLGKTGKTVNNYADHVIACLKYLQNTRGQKLRLRLEAVERCEEDSTDTPHFNAKEIKLIKQECQGLRELLLVSLILDSGMRIKEVNNLKLENLDGLTITIVGKGRKKRPVFILPETRDLLDRWVILADIAKGHVFPSPTKFGDSLSVQQVRWSINAPIRRAGFEEGSAHAVRRGAITGWLNNGMKLQDVTKMAGHTSPETTLKHYYKVTNKELGERYAQAMS